MGCERSAQNTGCFDSHPPHLHADEWDKDGGGSIDFKELQKVLRAPASPPVPAAKKSSGKGAKGKSDFKS